MVVEARRTLGMLTVVAVTVVATLGVQAAFATAGSQSANLGAKRLAVVYGDGPVTASNFTGVFVGSTRITIPASTTGLLRISFSGEGTCNFGAAGQSCWASLYVRNLSTSAFATLFPRGTLQVDTDDTGDNYVEPFSVERTTGALPAAQYEVLAYVYVACSGGGSCGTTYRVTSWILSAELWKVT